MSYILDALRKSEHERRPSGNLRIGARDAGPVALPGHSLAFYAAPVIVVAALGAAAYLWLARPFQGPAPTISVVANAPVADASASATPPAPPAMKEPAIAPSAPVPLKAASPVRDLVEQTRVAPAPPVRASAPVAAAAPTRAASITSVASAPRRAGDDVRLLRVMPPDFQKSLPEMVVNIHVYAANEAERILYINNRQYQAGDKVRDDVVVEEIVEDGAVLNFRGQRFKLPRPS